MEIIFILFIVISLWHFIYDGIILPDLRTDLRYKLFTLRDQLRKLKQEKENFVSDEAFEYLDTSLSNSIRHLPFINFAVIFQIHKKIQNTPELKAAIDDKIKILDNCKVSEVRDIRDKMTRFSGLGFIANSGGWLLYAIPIIIVVLLISIVFNLVSTCKKKVRAYVQGIVLTPENEAQKLYIYSDIHLT